MEEWVGEKEEGEEEEKWRREEEEEKEGGGLEDRGEEEALGEGGDNKVGGVKRTVGEEEMEELRYVEVENISFLIWANQSDNFLQIKTIKG